MRCALWASLLVVLGLPRPRGSLPCVFPGVTRSRRSPEWLLGRAACACAFAGRCNSRVCLHASTLNTLCRVCESQSWYAISGAFF